jgi:hypothetical protein
MNHFLPLFPLKLVAFPGEKLNLHIYEPRYKQLIRECEHNKTTFGIPSFINEEVMPYGTELRLLSIEKKYDNGELDIKTQGVGIFKTETFYKIAPGKLYPGADIKRIKLTDDSDLILNEKILTKLEELFSVLKVKKKLPRSPSLFRIFDIAHFIGLNIEQEYGLLTLPSELERQEFILKHLEKLIPVVKSMEESKKRAKMNGHFKHLKPPKF